MDKLARADCRYCRCLFEFTKKEAKRTGDIRDGDFWTIACSECKSDCHVSDTLFRHEERLTTPIRER